MNTAEALSIPKNYFQFLKDLKQKISRAQLRAAVSVNKELLILYWEVGKGIIERQKSEKWGSSVIEKLSKDLQNSFPGIRGFSRANIFKMRAFYHMKKSHSL